MILGANRLGSASRNPREIAGDMACRTVRTQVASVWITVAVDTAVASNGEGWIERQVCSVRLLPGCNAQGRGLCRSGLVAEGTSRRAMRPSPNELRHPVVTELRGHLEGVRTMTLVTVLPELALVLVILLVTVEAAVLGDLVALVDVARYARDGLVLAFERIGLMIEHLRPWRIEMQEWGVALLAVLA
jgi:hypothetical protein